MHLRPNCDPSIDPYTSTGSPRSPRPKERDPTYDQYGGDLIAYLRNYYAMCSQIDQQIGRITQALTDYGLTDNTAVFYTFDHGDMQGSHGLINKRRPFEESAGVPLVVSFPDRNQPRNMNQPVAGIDILTTRLDWAGIIQPEGIDGTSFLSHVCHKTEQNENETRESDQPENQPTTKPVFVESRNWCMVVDGPWKLIAERDQQHLTPQRTSLISTTIHTNSVTFAATSAISRFKIA